MVITTDEKQYIIERMQNSNPANGLSANHFRTQVGTSNPKLLLKNYMKQMVGGLSEEDAKSILATTSYSQMNPSSLILGNKLIDYSKTVQAVRDNTAFRAAHKIPSTDVVPNYDRPFPISAAPQNTEEPVYVADSTSTSLSGLNVVPKGLIAAGDKPKKTMNLSTEQRAKRAENGTKAMSIWTQFYRKCSVWPVFDNMDGHKRKAVSLLYKRSKLHGIESIIPFEGRRYESFEDYQEAVTR